MNTKEDLTTDVVGIRDAELSSDDLETVSGGKDWTETSGSYDAGYALTAMVKQIYDFGRGLVDGIADDE